MKLKPIYFINSIVFASFLRFIIIPIEDYPDIINLYVDKRSGVLNSENWIGYFARLFRLDELFTSPCYVVRSSSIINDYFFGGGFYKCTSFPISIRYLSISLLLLSLIIIFFLFCYKLSYQLGNNQKIIFKKTLFFLLLLPATNYFLLMLHTDNLYNFLIIPFIMFSFYFSFKEIYFKFIPISAIPFAIIYFSRREDNQFIIVILLFASYLLTYFLHKRKFIINLFNKLSQQFLYFLNLDFKKYKRIFIILVLFGLIVQIILLNFRLQLFDILAINPVGNVPIAGNIQRIAEQYGNEENILLFTTIEKYPIYIRLFGLLQGLILSTTFGIKPSIITTLFFFSSFIIGFLKCYSFDNVIPSFIKLYFLILLFITIFTVTIFPFFSYAKYWLFFLPFLGLFMSFTPRLSIISIGFIYLELVLKSSWLH